MQISARLSFMVEMGLCEQNLHRMISYRIVCSTLSPSCVDFFWPVFLPLAVFVIWPRLTLKEAQRCQFIVLRFLICCYIWMFSCRR